jgi:putative transposase
VGSAKLVVDGTDEILVRKAEIALTPTRVQGRTLDSLLEWSRQIYNGALQHRRDAWRIAQVSLSRFDQFAELSTLRENHPQAVRFGIQPMRGALSLVDEAFAGFFRRVDEGGKAGYPRFRSRGRFRSVCYDEPKNWTLRGLNSGLKSHGAPARVLYVQGVGEFTLSKRGARQLSRFLARGGEPRTLTITRTRTGSWRATVGFRGVHAMPLPENTQVGGVDRGVTITAALPDGTLLRCPEFLKGAREEIGALQREREMHQPFSSEWKKANKAIAKTYARAHRRSENWARHTAREVVARYGVISLEDLSLTNMTKSAKGTVERPGKGVAAKKGLNRSLQDAALGRLAYWISVKAEEAGRRVWKVDPKNSSRQCAACGHTEAANRHRAQFACRRCGHHEHADVNAAQVISARGESADARWRDAGSPLLNRSVSQSQRRRPTMVVPIAIPNMNEPGTGQNHGAGSAPDAAVA